MKVTSSPPGRGKRAPSAKVLAVASAAVAAGAVVAVSIAGALVVNADEVAQAAAASSISEDSTSARAPEKAAETGVAPEPLSSDLIKLPREPLTLDEVAYARAASSVDPLFVDAMQGAGEAPTYLSTVIVEPEAYDDNARRLEVVYYDYGTDRVLRFVVNVTAATVEIAESSNGVQPPPSDTEVATALSILLEDPLSAPMKRMYLDLEGTELTSPDQTIYNGSSYIATPADAGAESCGPERCVMLLVQTPGHAYLPTTQIVVNLSQKSVLEIH